MTVLCALCDDSKREILWLGERLRIARAREADYPGFLRVIWNDHVAEMTDLSPQDRDHYMQIIWLVERAIREVLRPDKVNIASLGNQIPHLHWHVIPRWKDDVHFPDSVWSAARRSCLPEQLATRAAQDSELKPHLLALIAAAGYR